MRLRVLTWPGDRRYLAYLACVPHDFFVVGTAGGGVRLPDTVTWIAAEEVRRLPFDCVLFQSPESWTAGRETTLSAEQRRLPRIYLEHRPPALHPTDEPHPVDDPETLLVHVTHFNALAWDNGRTPVRVIEHGVQIPEGVLYSGKLTRGITAIDDLAAGGRRLGADVFARVRSEVAVDLVGERAQLAGGLGQVPHALLAEFMSAYRFYFDPARQYGPSLELCEAMMIGLPVVAVATAGISGVVHDGVSGHVDANPRAIVARMRELLASPGEAWRLGQGARRTARDRFDLRRFVRDWDQALRSVAGGARWLAPRASAGMGVGA